MLRKDTKDKTLGIYIYKPFADQRKRAERRKRRPQHDPITLPLQVVASLRRVCSSQLPLVPHTTKSTLQFIFVAATESDAVKQYSKKAVVVIMQSQQAATSQNLHVLLPSYTRPTFPQELISLSQSLQALSRSRASTLKPDEEIARGFACCHLACERLKQKLNLPTITVSAPCGPRIYKKLFQFLDKALPEQTPTTPRKNASTYDETGSAITRTPTARTPGSVATPSNPARGSQPGTPTPLRHSMAFPGSDMPERKKRRLDDGGDVLASLKKRSDAPEWLHSATQYLAKKFICPAAAPYVYQGVCEVSKNKRLPEEEMASLVVAVLLAVLNRMGRMDNMATSYMVGVREMVALRRVGITRMGAVVTDVERWIEEEADGWKTTAWFESVPVNGAGELIDALPNEAEVQAPQATPRKDPSNIHTQLSQPATPAKQTPQKERPVALSHLPPQSEAEVDDHDEDMEDASFEADFEPGIRQPSFPQRQGEKKTARSGTTRGGIGTMIQPANDWLSEERRADFAAWKAQIMCKIEAAERRQQKAAAA
ncbi:hypothetical protein FH972_022337 [Carpinus fangiana]|uniref:ORC6 first cyclin-like domain-containing protein n=1 Tax=Carpinus fangiana TaxID=176857 RepID=A0A5N6KSC2_9ROSI|nr:hypothetical protein FH972_022337 [Carpinus fangiana]